MVFRNFQTLKVLTELRCLFCEIVFRPLFSYVSVNPKSASIAVGGSRTFTATARDGLLVGVPPFMSPPVEDFPLTWLSSNPAVASINANGVATGLQVGTTQITARANGVTSKPVSLTVTSAGDFTPPARYLWVPDWRQHLLRAYSPAQLGASTTAAAEKRLRLPAGSAPNALAFDAQGNLWVAASGTNRLLMFSAAQVAALAAGESTLTPARTLVNNGSALMEPVNILFDAGGNLWVSQFGGSVFRLTPTQLAGAAPLPTQASISGSIAAGLLFDTSGTLWVTMAGTNSLEAYDVSTMPPRRLVSIRGTNTRLSYPEGIAFSPVQDATCPQGGYLWVANNQAVANVGGA